MLEDPTHRVRINRDDIRESLFGSNYVLNREGEGKVTQVEHNLLNKALKNGQQVVSDNTYLDTRFLSKVLNIAHRYNAPIDHKDFPISLEEAKRRNSLRDRVVPEGVIDRMYAKLGRGGQFPVFPGSYPVAPFSAPSEKGKLAVCFDMDGTLNDVRAIRHFVAKPKHKNFDAFHRMSEFEPANEDVLQMAHDAHDAGFSVLITTARQEKYRETTQKWCDDHGVPYENIFMRPDNDTRPDYAVKKDMMSNIREYYDVVRCVDDNPQAIQAWKELGIHVSEVPFINNDEDTDTTVSIHVPNVFRQGVCIRCGRPFKGEGALGPSCRQKGR